MSVTAWKGIKMTEKETKGVNQQKKKQKRKFKNIRKEN
jgi:hypothetical protein